MSNVKAGQVYVEIGADPRKFFAALNKANKALGNMGRGIRNAGAGLAGVGAATLAPFAGAVRSGAQYESTLLNIKASTGATAAELDKIKTASMQMSAAMGKGPTEIAGGFLELLKAGMSVESVLGGAGQAALEFAAVGQMDVAAAAVVMADAMNVFGVDASTAANAISSAADASSTSIELMSQSFAQVSAVAALANQSIGDTSAAMAVLANAGIKGSDAGTSLKTMLMRLMAPADDAVGALGQIGLSVASFRNADGSMKPLVEIIGTLNGALGNMDQAAKDDIFRRIFGQDAIRAAAVLTASGVDGFNSMRNAMGGAMSVGDKYAVLMSGLAGAGMRLMAAMERLAIAISEAVGPAFLEVANAIGPIVDGFAKFVSANKELAQTVVQVAAGAVVAGGALIGLGVSLQTISYAISPVLKGIALIGPAIGMVLSPVGLLVAAFAAMVAFGPQIAASMQGMFGGVGELINQAAGAIGGGFNAAVADGMIVLGDLATTAQTTFTGIYNAIAEGDLAGAMDVLWAGLQAGWLRGVEALMGVVDPWISMFQNAFTIMGAEIYKGWDWLWTNVSSAFNTVGAVIQGSIDNVINGVLASWDTLEKGIRESWNYIQSFFTKGFDLKAENEKVKNEMDARARKRELERPGIEGRTEEAKKKNAEAEQDRKDRAKAVDANTQATIDQREQANADNRASRRAATQAAEGNLNSIGRGKREQRAMNGDFAALLKDIESASSLDQLRDLYTQYDALASNGRLSSVQSSTLEAALDDATERVSKATSSMGGASPESKAAEAGAQSAAIGAKQSQSEVAGTFSSVALGGMGFGSSLAQKQLDTLKAIEHNTSQNAGAEVQA